MPDEMRSEMRKGQANPRYKFDVSLIGVSGNCAHKRHNVCFNLNCTCECHFGKAERARRAGLRTIPKPGEPGYIEKAAMNG